MAAAGAGWAGASAAWVQGKAASWWNSPIVQVRACIAIISFMERWTHGHRQHARVLLKMWPAAAMQCMLAGMLYTI